MKKGYFYMLVTLILIGCSASLEAQDIHYSQFYNSPQTMNPGLTGVFKGDQRFMANVRDQWRWVPVPWFTFGAAYDQKFLPKKSTNHFYSGGINLFHDRQGDSRINLSTINVSGSYSRILTPNHVLTGGLTLGFSTRGFSTDDLTWDKQWDGESFDPTLPDGENFNTKRIYFLETGAGINYRFQTSSRTHIDAGVGAFHFIKPSAGYYDNEDQKLPINLNFNLIGSFYVMDILDLQVHGLQQMQGEYRETIVGLLGKIYVSQKRGKETQLHVGVGYRTSGSIIPTLALAYGQYYLGANIDFDGTEFNDIEDSNRGAIELHFRYTITHVKPLSQFKVCPIY